MKKSLGTSLAHGVAKRELRERGAVFKDKFHRSINEAFFGKQTNTAIYNRVNKKLKKELGSDLLFTYETGAGKKRKMGYCVSAYYEDTGIALLEFHINFSPLVDLEIGEERLSISEHALARIYQTFGVSSFREFIRNHREIILAIFHVSVVYPELAKNITLTEEECIDVHMWHPLAEFRCSYALGVIRIDTVISTKTTNEQKLKLIFNKKEERSLNFFWLPKEYETMIRATRNLRLSFSQRKA
jgi:hypothetical protein